MLVTWTTSLDALFLIVPQSVMLKRIVLSPSVSAVQANISVNNDRACSGIIMHFLCGNNNSLINENYSIHTHSRAHPAHATTAAFKRRNMRHAHFRRAHKHPYPPNRSVASGAAAFFPRKTVARALYFLFIVRVGFGCICLYSIFTSRRTHLPVRSATNHLCASHSPPHAYARSQPFW